MVIKMLFSNIFLNMSELIVIFIIGQWDPDHVAYCYNKSVMGVSED